MSSQSSRIARIVNGDIAILVQPPCLDGSVLRDNAVADRSRRSVLNAAIVALLFILGAVPRRVHRVRRALVLLLPPARCQHGAVQ